MKTLIFENNSYNQDIFDGEPVYIKQVYFAGITTRIDYAGIDEDGVDEYFVLIHFQILDYDGRLLNLTVNCIAEDKHEIKEINNIYSNVPSIATISSALVPTIFPLSCFYKINPENKLNKVKYRLYCRQAINNEDEKKVIYKVDFNKPSFITMSSIIDHIINKIPFSDYTQYNILNGLSENIETVNIDSSYKCIIRNIYLNTKHIKNKGISRLFQDNKDINGFALLTFKNNNSSLRVFIHMTIPYKYIKDTSKSRYETDLNKFIEYEKTLEKDKCYLQNDIIGETEIRYALKADNPMTKILYYCNGYKDKDLNPGIYLEFMEDKYTEILDLIVDYLKK